MNYYRVIFMLISLNCMAHLEVNNEPARVTIFVHGTHRTHHKLGYIPGVGAYVNHEDGLYKPEECLPEYVYRRLATTISQHSPVEFPAENFYIFCWSGMLSHDARLAASKMLHDALNNLVLAYGKKCTITLITHSHGGNVALNLAGITGVHEYTVDNLILLAVPVQHLTQDYVDSSLFKNVLSIYSRWDFIQIGDPQGLGQSRRMVRKVFTREGQGQSDLEEMIPLFSRRRFASEKVKHIEIRHTTLFGNRPISHVEFLLPHFTQNIASILKKSAGHDFTHEHDLVVNLEKVSLFESLFC